MSADKSNPKLPPHSIEAEQSLIACLLRDNSTWDRIADIVTANDCYSEDHQQIVALIVALIVSGRPADVVTVFAHLQPSTQEDQQISLAYLQELLDATESAENVQSYAQIVREKSILRRLIRTCETTIADAYDSSASEYRRILDSAEQNIVGVTDAGAFPRRHTAPLSAALGDVIGTMESQLSREAPTKVRGVSTGFVELDNLTSGLQRGDLVLIAGNNGAGKTALASNIATHVAVDLRLPVLMFSFDLSSDQLGMRILSSRSGVDIARLRTADLREEDWDRLTVGLGVLRDAPLHIEACGVVSLPVLRSIARRIQHESDDLALIVIDSIRMISSLENYSARSAELDSALQGLKRLTRELNVPVIVTSDLDEVNALSNIADFADLVMLIEGHDEPTKTMTTELVNTNIIIRKNRNGSTGAIRLNFSKMSCRFDFVPMAARV